RTGSAPGRGARALCTGRSSPPAPLGRLPDRAGQHRVLAGARLAPARPPAVRPGGRRLAPQPPGPLIRPLSAGGAPLATTRSRGIAGRPNVRKGVVEPDASR